MCLSIPDFMMIMTISKIEQCLNGKYEIKKTHFKNSIIGQIKQGPNLNFLKSHERSRLALTR